MRKVKVLLDRDFAIGDDRPAPVRRLRRASRPLRLWRHLRARPSRPPTSRASAATCSRWCASSRRPSCAIPAATSSPATTGRTASARSRSGRAGSTSPGCRPSRTRSAPTSSSTGAALAGIEPMLAVNLGTRGADAARNLVEYCNHPGGTALSDLRRAARLGAAARRQVLVPRQRDGRPVADGGARPRPNTAASPTEAAKMMRWIDPTHRARRLRLVRPHHADLRRLGATRARAHASTTSSSSRCTPISTTTPATRRRFLASPDLMDSFIEEVVAIADAVAARRRSPKRIMLSFDEWNVWYRTRRGREERVKPGWPVAPQILEEIYTMEDALAFGGACISLLNHADRVKAACLAQLVNVIAPIMTETGGPAWRQTIFFPFADFSNLGRGRVLRAQVDCADLCGQLLRSARRRRPPLPAAGGALPEARRRARRAAGTLTLFALNRHLEQALTVEVDAPRVRRAGGGAGAPAPRRRPAGGQHQGRSRSGSGRRRSRASRSKAAGCARPCCPPRGTSSAWRRPATPKPGQGRSELSSLRTLFRRGNPICGIAFWRSILAGWARGR